MSKQLQREQALSRALSCGSGGREMPLAEALEEIVGGGVGTFLSRGGRLAYFEDEDERWILQRTGKR